MIRHSYLRQDVSSKIYYLQFSIKAKKAREGPISDEFSCFLPSFITSSYFNDLSQSFNF